jgi:hypothetical protein
VDNSWITCRLRKAKSKGKKNQLLKIPSDVRVMPWKYAEVKKPKRRRLSGRKNCLGNTR